LLAKAENLVQRLLKVLLITIAAAGERWRRGSRHRHRL
jgi:hypothetical protein